MGAKLLVVSSRGPTPPGHNEQDVLTRPVYRYAASFGVGPQGR